MRKLRILSITLCLILILSSAPGVTAIENGLLIPIMTVDDLLLFAENCRLDSYSDDLTVKLCADLDLTGIVFSGIPIFSGTFLGGNHTISGLNIQPAGSNVGFFRYLTETASVQDLNLVGTVAPKGSASAAGGFVGSNAGTLKNCTFSGTVSGAASIGGLAGINLISGLIEESTVYGSVNGIHFVGGITGENHGIVRYSHNRADVNTKLAENQISLEDITLDSITSSESAATTTDVGGICGTGTGVIRECTNHGNVGYPKIGYNVGGIAGSFGGYIFCAINYGTVDGRKEVGGIVGQLEPAVHILYEEDTLQTLEEQLDTMSGMTGAAGSHAQSGSTALTNQSLKMEQQIKDAQKALEVLLPNDKEESLPPDEDEVQAAQNALSSSIAGMSESLSTMISIADSTVSTLSQDLQNIAGQMTAIGGTIGSAGENMGGSITDASDRDTSKDLTAKIYTCLNQGSVSGDWNVGGIVGAISFENDMDPDANVHPLGQSSFKFNMELRAVILDSNNCGNITGNKQNIGGIVGWMSMGLTRSCVNTGAVEAASASYTGGICGSSQGYIRENSVKCLLSGSTVVGGISGTGSVVSDNYAMVTLDGISENAGAILGSMGDAQLERNYYLITGNDIGAIDGISYQDLAQPLSSDAFFKATIVPYSFSQSTVRFLLDSHAVEVSVAYGETLTQDQIPALPRKDGFDGSWEGAVTLSDKIYFDTVFSPAYTSHDTVLQSSNLGSNQKPVFLAQGDFAPGATIDATVYADASAIDAWQLRLPASGSAVKLRFLIPHNHEADALRLLTSTDGSNWTETEFQTEGSYLIFTAEHGDLIIKLELIPENNLIPILCGSAGIVVLLIIAAIIIKKRKKV